MLKSFPVIFGFFAFLFVIAIGILWALSTPIQILINAIIAGIVFYLFGIIISISTRILIKEILGAQEDDIKEIVKDAEESEKKMISPDNKENEEDDLSNPHNMINNT